MRKFLIFCLFLPIIVYATPQTCDPKLSQGYDALKWYRDSAERKAIYHEVFYWGEKSIHEKIAHEHLKPHKWGVIFDIDETLLDNSELNYKQLIGCKPFTDESFVDFMFSRKGVATPGGQAITCNLQKLGAFVSLVTNRDGSYHDPKTHDSVMSATLDNLRAQHICFDQIIFAQSPTDRDKNPRFKAVISGQYPKDLVITNKLPPHQVIAYFGDNIQDTPNMDQIQLSKDHNPQKFDRFGSTYFTLPNPVYGSWKDLALK